MWLCYFDPSNREILPRINMRLKKHKFGGDWFISEQAPTRTRVVSVGLSQTKTGPVKRVAKLKPERPMRKYDWLICRLTRRPS